MKEKENRQFKKMERSAGKGIPGVYTALLYRLMKIVLPVLLAVCIALGTFFAARNELQNMGAYRPEKTTIFVSEDYYDKVDLVYRVYAKKLGISLSFEEFLQQVDLQATSKAQRKSLLLRHQQQLDYVPIYVVITKDNELLGTYKGWAMMGDLLQDLKKNGLLEVEG